MGEQKGARDGVAHHQADDADVAEEKGYQGPGPVGDSLIPRLPPAFPPSAPTAITSALPAPVTARRTGRFVRLHPGHFDRITDLRTSRFRFAKHTSYFFVEGYRKTGGLGSSDPYLLTIYRRSRNLSQRKSHCRLETAVEELLQDYLPVGLVRSLIYSLNKSPVSHLIY